MTKLLKKVIGVDVGAKFLTVSFNDSNNQDQVYNIGNNQRSILSFLKKMSAEEFCFVIEATGNYSSRILHLSLEQGFETSLINCMSVKHFARMKNIIAKTLTEISYHINSGNWEHTRKYYENDGIEELRT